MQSAVICYAPPDAQFASALGVFLEVNCALTVSHQESGDLVDAVERGLSDITLVLLSPASVLKTWRRERWEPVFLNQPGEFGTKIAFLLLSECKFPELLRRGDFFDLSVNRLEGQRRVKRWLLERVETVEFPDGGAPQELTSERLEQLRQALADQPGMEDKMSAAEALAFAHAAKDDFEGVFWIDCTHRSRAGILGDVAQSLGLRLSGTADQNRIALEDFCDGRRCLFVFQNIAPEHRDLSELGVKTSAILTTSTDSGPELSFEKTCNLFAAWPRRSGECLGRLGVAQWHLRQSSQVGPLGSSMVAFLKYWDRLAEAHEILELLINSAQGRADFQTLYRLKWEQGWILEHWNQPVAWDVAGHRVSQPDQLALNFGEV